MYVTRPLSLYKNDPSALGLPPPEGPHSAYLLLQEDAEEQDRKTSSFFWGFCKDPTCRTLPFPQDKLLKVQFTTSDGPTPTGINPETGADKTFFIPVLGQPLSSNLYYVVKAGGRNKGLVHTCSREEDKITRFFRKWIKDVKPMPFNASNIYQQMKIIKYHSSGFKAESAVSDGFAPEFIREKGWDVYHSDLPGKMKLTHADGLNVYLRSRTPDFDFSLSQKGSSTVIVGEWYCPFMFITDFGSLENLENQMKESLFYRMSLEQQWVEIFNDENYSRAVNVTVKTNVRREEALIGAGKYIVNDSNVVDGMLVLRGRNKVGELTVVGLSLEILEKMRNEQGAGRQEEVDVCVERVFEYENDAWTKFGCYILEERYVLRRMDGTVVLTYTFRDLKQIKPKWEVLY